MTMNKHTPGPWRASIFRRFNGSEIPTIYGPQGVDVAQALCIDDARLIASAPALLAALIGAEKCIAASLQHLPPDTLGIFVGEWLDEIREAIKTATRGE